MKGIGGLLLLGASLVIALIAVRLVDGATAPALANTRAPATPRPGTGALPLVIEPLPDGRRRITHAHGVSVVPRSPQRIASFGWTDEMLACGVQPHAAGGDRARGFPPHLADRLHGTLIVDHMSGGPNLEALAAAQPDLIIAVWYWRSRYALLSRIAPTVVLQPGHWFWRERFTDVCAILGRATAGADRLARVDALIAATRARIQARIGGESVAMLRVFARELRLYGQGYSGPLLYGDLQLTPPAIVERLAWRRPAARLSLEGLVDLDADHLLLMHQAHIPITHRELETLRAHPIWRQLRAVKAGNVYPVPDLLMRGGVISREVTLRRLGAQLGG